MLQIYTFGLIVFGFFLITSSLLILSLEKNMIELPSLFVKNKESLNNKYRFHTQLLSGIMLVFYGILLYEIRISYLAIHLIALVITYIVIDGMGYLKFIG